MLLVLAHLANGSDTNSEAFGYVMVFGLLFLIFVIAKLFGPRGD